MDINKIMKNKKDLIIVPYVNLDFGGFLIKINTIIVDQNITNIIHPVIKA